MIYTKKDMVTVIHNAAQIYESEMCHKNRLIIYGAPNAPSYIQTKANERNFYHLTGVICKIKSDDPLDMFYSKAKNKKLSVNDFEINSDGTTQLKMEVLNQVLNISKNAKMIGNFNNGRIKLQTDKIAGGTKSCIGFVNSNGLYVPNTVLNDDIRHNVTDNQRILAILSKNEKDESYEHVDYVAKKIEIKPLLTRLSKNVPIDKSLYQDNDSLESCIADKIAIVSTDAVCNNPRDLIELYELTKQGTVRNTDIEHISIECEHVFQSFDAYLHNTIEIEHAYKTLEDIEEKPNFGELHERLDKFLSPFIVKEHESLIWSPTSATWEREKELADRTDSETQVGVKPNVSHEIKTNTIDTENNATRTGTKSASDDVKDAKLTTKLAKLNATIDDFTLVPQDKSTPVDNLTHYFN